MRYRQNGSVRTLQGESLDAAVSRVRRYPGRLAMAWVASRQVEPPELIAVSLRGGVAASDINWAYEGLQIRCEDLDPHDAAARLEAGRVTHAPGPPALQCQQGSSAYWYTTGVESKMSAPLDSPSYYFTCQLGGRERVQNFPLSEPLFGPGLPYFPRATDAIFQTLYGVTRDQGRRDIMSELLLELPYKDASIRGLSYDDAGGLAVLIGGTSSDSARGHTLEVAWKLDAADRSLSRTTVVIDAPGPVVVDTGAPPSYITFGLMDSNGMLVDSADAYAERDREGVDGKPLPPQALGEALDHLDSVWRNAFGDWLFHHVQLTEASGLSLAVSSRADFESRLSYVADILKSAVVPDPLLDQKSAQSLRADASLGRLRAALAARLAADDTDIAMRSLDVLVDANRLRVALQHARADDLPSAMARLGLGWPGDWGDNWELLRHVLVRSLTNLRQAVISLIPNAT